jgi:hypothetical protein
MKHISDIVTFYEFFDEIKEDGFFPVKCKSVLQFFMLKGRTVVINKENIVPIPDLAYVVKAKTPERYYLRKYHAYDLDQLYFYRQSDTFSGQDAAIENLRRYTDDNNIWLLFTKDQSAMITDMLTRVYKSQFKTEGKVPYPIFMQLMKLYLDLEDYEQYSKHLTGSRTVINQYTTHINELWKGTQPK